jgi:clan AA aspartic protease
VGSFAEEITLKNAYDVGKAREGLIKEEDIRHITVTAVVDTGAGTLFIDEETCQTLGLAIIDQRDAYIANGTQVPCKVTGPVQICWKNRSTDCRAVVMPGSKKILLGAIPLEDMDLMVDPVNQKLTGVHGDKIVALAL